MTSSCIGITKMPARVVVVHHRASLFQGVGVNTPMARLLVLSEIFLCRKDGQLGWGGFCGRLPVLSKMPETGP